MADRAVLAVEVPEPPDVPGRDIGQGPAQRPAGVSRWVNARGQISLAGFAYSVGATFSGEPVEAVVTGGLVQILHRGVLIATHAQRLRPDHADRGPRAPRLPAQRRARQATTGLTVTRKADARGVISFAGSPYPCGRAWARADVQVTIVAGSVQLTVQDKVLRVHPIRHDRSKELGAFATPHGRPRQVKTTDDHVAHLPERSVARVPVLDISGRVFTAARRAATRRSAKRPDQRPPDRLVPRHACLVTASRGATVAARHQRLVERSSSTG